MSDLSKKDSSADEAAPEPLFRDRARQLRREGTDAERKLWSRLRNNGLGFKFRRQHQIGPFIVDFFSLEARLIVEVDGGQHHDSSEQRADEERTRYLEGRGFTVVRFWNDEVLRDTEAVLARILDLL
ncbi:MAG: endonuclease domain-containing protein [Candidatus Binataceae bacterium]